MKDKRPFSDMTLKEGIAYLIETHFGGNKTKFAKTTGLAKQTVYNMLNGKTLLSDQDKIKIAEVCDINAIKLSIMCFNSLGYVDDEHMMKQDLLAEYLNKVLKPKELNEIKELLK